MPIALPTDVVITPQMVRGLSSEQIDRLYEEIEEGADPRPTLTLKEFMVQAWPILEPRTPFVDGWHIDAICEHLTACSDGLILDLLINIPPRMSKSLLVSVMWFCWTWSYLPETRWMYSCYHEPLALRDSIKCRTLLQSPWYRANWGTRFRLKPDQNAKSRFENDHTGFRLATGVGGGQTGEGGDFIVCLEGSTLVRTEIGDIAIGEIVEKRLPVRVLSYDHGTAAARWQPIEKYEQAKGRESVRVTTSRGDFIDCTSDHPFYVQGCGYVRAANLIPGDEALTDAAADKDTASVTIRSVERIPNIERVYNIRVAEDHNYFAGGILLHNCDDPHNVTQAESELVRMNTVNWWCEVMSTRGNDAKRAVHVIVMQRVHERDLSGEVIARELGYERLIMPMRYEDTEEARARVTSLGWRDPRTEDGELLCPGRMDDADVTKREKILGPYGCNPAEAPILMADLSMRPIGEIRVGDEIVGFDKRIRTDGKRGRHKLTKATVLEVHTRRAPIVKMTLDSGAQIRCTRDHKWFTKDRGVEREMYMPAIAGRSRLGRVCPASLPTLTGEEERLAGWLSGFFDGEGSATSGRRDVPGDYRPGSSICFYQGSGRNLPLCEKLERALAYFGFPYSYTEDDRKDNKTAECYGYRCYRLEKPGLPMLQRFLHIVQPTKWRDRICNGAFGAKFIKARERVESVEEDGEETVYALTTTTGNYVVWGLASSNSAGQHQQRPAPRGGGMFRREWFGEPLTELPKTQTVPGKHGAEEVKISYRYVRYWDKAGVASGKRYGDWTVGTLMARSDDGIFYVVDVVRGQWEAKERNGIILNTARADQARFGRVTIYVEQEPGLAKESTDYILRLLAGFNVRAYRSNKDKEGRVEPLQAQAAARNVKLIRGQWIRAWLDELEVYPNGSNDDQGDSAGGAFNCLSTSGKNIIERRKMGVSTRFA